MTDRDAGYRDSLVRLLAQRLPFTSHEVIEPLADAIRALPLPSTPDDGKAEPVAVKLLAWRDHRPDSFPEPAWSAETPFGFYHIEEVCASDSPAYVVRLHAHHFIADKDGLNEAKEAAQFDYEQRIRSALVHPSPASDGAIREAIKEACDLLAERKYGNPARSPGHNARLVLERALSAHAGDAAKSDGGVEVVTVTKETAMRIRGIEPGPPDTHAEVKG